MVTISGTHLWRIHWMVLLALYIGINLAHYPSEQNARTLSLFGLPASCCFRVSKPQLVILSYLALSGEFDVSRFDAKRLVDLRPARV